jgi:outer membrane protein assembly factor BamB
MASVNKNTTNLAGWLAALLSVLASSSWGADQPQWGERFSRNMVSGEKGLADGFDPVSGKNVKWVAKIGSETHSTPVIAGGRVLVGTNNAAPRDNRHQGDRGVFMCFDERGGQFLWQLVVPKLEDDQYLDWPKAGMASAATVEGERVYMLSNRGEVMCLDLNGMANGNDGPFMDEGKHMTPRGEAAMQAGPKDADIIWLYDLVSQVHIHPHDQIHASILLVGDLLYINSCNGVDNTHRRIREPDAPSLVVLDKRTGRLVAKDDERIGPRIFHCQWSSPSLGEVAGRPLIFFGGDNGVCYAFEALRSAPADGPATTLKNVWRFDCDPLGPKENVHRFIGNRRQGPSVIFGMPVFHDGRVYVTSGGDLWWGKKEGSLKCIDPTKTGDVTKSAEIWSYPLKQTCSTAAVYDNMVFVTDCGGTIHCVDAASGRANWTHEVEGEIWASPLVADGKVYVGTRRGQFLVFAASKGKRLISSVELRQPISATAVAANGVVYVATMSQLYAVQQEAGK